jgi:hypothetical protein
MVRIEIYIIGYSKVFEAVPDLCRRVRQKIIGHMPFHFNHNFVKVIPNRQALAL